MRPGNVIGFPDVRDVPVYIYALTEPAGAIRYIGKSANPEARFGHHCTRYAAKAVRNWVAELAARGARPGLVILHTVPPGQDAAPWEVHFVHRHRAHGGLLNKRTLSEIAPACWWRSPRIQPGRAA